MPSNNDKYAATSWGGPTEFDFECPSGQLCLMRKVDISVLMEKGLLTKLDSLTSIVENEVIPKNAKQKAEAEAQKIKSAVDTLKSRTPEEMRTIMTLVNELVVMSVVKPELHLVPANGKRRDGVIYVDSVGFGDRMAIFGKCMEDTANLRQFREGTGESLGDLEDVASVQLPSE